MVRLLVAWTFDSEGNAENPYTHECETLDVAMRMACSYFYDDGFGVPKPWRIIDGEKTYSLEEMWDYWDEHGID